VSDIFQPGDMALVHNSGFVSAAIRWGTRSRYNHVRLVTGISGNTVEAQPQGAVRGHVHPNDLVLRPPLLTSFQRAWIREAAAGFVLANHGKGIPYGFLDVAALGLAQFGITLPSVKRRIKSPDHLFCSQLYDYALSLAGYHLFTDDRTPQDVSPGDLADLAFREGWMRVQG
jgi:hypothetical protein